MRGTGQRPCDRSKAGSTHLRDAHSIYTVIHILVEQRTKVRLEAALRPIGPALIRQRIVVCHQRPLVSLVLHHVESPMGPGADWQHEGLLILRLGPLAVDAWRASYDIGRNNIGLHVDSFCVVTTQGGKNAVYSRAVQPGFSVDTSDGTADNLELNLARHCQIVERYEMSLSVVEEAY